MSSTLPPSFPVEKQKKRLEAFKADLSLKGHISKLLEGVFPHEALTNPMRGGGGVFFFGWRPNNYRLKIPIKEVSIGNLSRVKVGWGLFPVESKNNHTIKVSPQITLMLHKTCVIAIFSLKNEKGAKVWYKVSVNSVLAFQEWLDQKVKDIAETLIKATETLKIGLDLEAAAWVRHEDGVKNEEYLDSLPADLILHDTYVKKVYSNEAELNGAARVKNYITARAIENLLPELMEEVNKIHVKIDSLKPAETAAVPSSRFSSFPGKGAGWPLWQKFFKDNKEELGLIYKEV